MPISLTGLTVYQLTSPDAGTTRVMEVRITSGEYRVTE